MAALTLRHAKCSGPDGTPLFDPAGFPGFEIARTERFAFAARFAAAIGDTRFTPREL